MAAVAAASDRPEAAAGATAPRTRAPTSAKANGGRTARSAARWALWTTGFHKERDLLSYTQLEELTGLSRPTLSAAITDGLDRGVIVREKAGTSYYYSLNREYEIATSKEPLPVKNSNRTSKETLPEPVKKLNIQKKERNLKKDRSRKRDPRLDHPAMIAYNEVMRLWPPKNEWRDRVCEVEDIDRCRKVLISWSGKGWTISSLPSG